MTAIKPIAKGEEIFNFYGEYPRSELLRRYGYANESYALCDVVDLSLRPLALHAGTLVDRGKEDLNRLVTFTDGFVSAAPPLTCAHRQQTARWQACLRRATTSLGTA